MSEGEVSSKYIIGKIDFLLALQTIFGENQVNIMQKKIEKEELKPLVSTLSENETREMERKDRKDFLYVLQTIFRGKVFKIMQNTAQKRGTKSIRGGLE